MKKRIILAIHIVLLLVCSPLAAEDPSYLITDTKIVAVPSADRPLEMANKDSCHYFISSVNFKPAGESFEKIGAVNKHATIASEAAFQNFGVNFLLDSAKPNDTAANILRLDINKDSLFTENVFVEITVGDDPQERFFKADALKVNIDGFNGTIAFEGEYRDYRNSQSDSRIMLAYLGSCLQGKVGIDGRQYLVQIVDGSGNLSYGWSRTITGGTTKFYDKPQDVIRIYEISGQKSKKPKLIWENFYAIPVKLGDKCYEIKHLPEKFNIEIKPSKNKLYAIDFNQADSYILLNKTGLLSNTKFYCNGNINNFLPAGRYFIKDMAISRNGWTLVKHYRSMISFSVMPDGKNSVEVPSSLKLAAKIKKTKANNYEIEPLICDQSNKEYYLQKNDALPEIGFKIADNQGKTVASGKFEYG